MENLDNTLDTLVASALSAVEAAADAPSLDEVRVQYLGKKGELTALLKSLGKLSAEERPKAGGLINKGKQQVQEAINQKRALMEQQALDAKLASEAIDVSLSGRGQDLWYHSPDYPHYGAGLPITLAALVLMWSKGRKSKTTITTLKP